MTEKEASLDNCQIFYQKCIDILCNQPMALKNAIYAISITAVFTITVAAIGFAVGFMLGAWTGPFAFLTAIASGSMAALAVAGGSTALGFSIGTAAFSCSLFKPIPSGLETELKSLVTNNANRAEPSNPRFSTSGALQINTAIKDCGHPPLSATT